MHRRTRSASLEAMAEDSVRKELEALLEQFFSPAATNEQRMNINQLLEKFAQQQEAWLWHYCVYFLHYSSNPHLLMYSLNLLENLVTYMWLSIDAAQRAEVRHFLIHHLLTNYTTLPRFIVNKIIKVITFIGRSDWPHEYPEFLPSILRLLRGRKTVVLGLQMLQTVSEELGSPRSDLLTSSRRETLLSLMTQQVPTFLSILINILDSVAERQRQGAIPTPPLSPNVSPTISPIKQLQPQPSSALTTPPHSSHTSHLTTPTHPLQPSPTKSPSPSSASSPNLPLNSELDEVCQTTLACLCHLFSWMPLSNTITPHVLDSIFYFANLGCDSATSTTDTSGRLGSFAMDCVIELLVKNCVPREFEAFLMKLFDKSFSLLQRLTGRAENREAINFTQLDDRFLAKCSDFFYWFVNSHLKRVEFNPNFPVLEFLVLFYQYTFKQPEVDSFCVCLDTWGVFLDHLIMMSSGIHGGQSPPNNNHYQRYREVLVTMMESVLRKMQLHHNINELREVDDESADDDNETEWQSFLRQCLEFVAKVAELFPMHAFSQLLPLLDSYSHVYLNLGQIVKQSGVDTYLSLSEGLECENLHSVLKDLTSVLQAIGRLAENFSGEHFFSRLNDAEQLVKKLCTIAKFSSDHMLFNVSTPVPEILPRDFVELHAQVLGSIQAYSHWLADLNLHSQRTGQHTDTVLWFVSVILDITYPLLAMQHVPEKVMFSACQLLLSLAMTVRPKFALTLPKVKELLDRGCRGLIILTPHKAKCMVYLALTALLVLPWPETFEADQQWVGREAELAFVIAGETKVLRQLQEIPQWHQQSSLLEEAKDSIILCLRLFHYLISSLSHECHKSKSILFRAISPSLGFTISLFSIYLHHAEILEPLTSFFLAVFDAMHGQVSVALTQQTTQTFMSLLTREHLEGALSEEESTATRVVEKFLCILQLLVQDSNTGDRSLLPSILSFAMKQIYPAIQGKPAPDVKSALFELLFQLLLNNWRYFFPSTILSHMDGDDTSGTLEHSDEFFSIMEAFGQSLLQQDIALFRQNLKSLEILNSKQKLYSRLQFREHMLYPLVKVLLEALVSRSHNLLQEEITLSIYSMASIDFPTYHQKFVMEYLSSVDGLSVEHRTMLGKNYRMVEDLPSFVLNLQQFVNDLRCYIILSKSIPGGSVRLS